MRAPARRARRAVPALGDRSASAADAGRVRRPRSAGRWCSRRPAAATTARASGWSTRPTTRPSVLASGTPLLAEEQVRDRARARRRRGPLAVRAGRGLAGGRDGAARRHLRRGDRAGAGRCPTSGPTQAQALALRIAAELGVTGVLAVELFETTDGRLLVNELAMRPHNSAHWTIEGARTSQFEQHLRAVLDYPLGVTEPTAPVVVMANLLGGPDDVVPKGIDERVHHFMARWPDVKIHLYGKSSVPAARSAT